MNKWNSIFSLALIFLSLFSFGQSDEQREHEVLVGQLATTRKVLRLLEAGRIDSVLTFVDAAYVKTNATLKTQLSKAFDQIKKVKDFAEVSEGLMVYEENHHVFRCVYHDTESQFQLVDIHYSETDANSKILKFKFKDNKILMKEKEERVKNSPDIPPPVKQ